jgi:hypothetical protein
MAEDDLFNFWGTTIIDPSSTGQSSTRGIQNTTLMDRDAKLANLQVKFKELTDQKYTVLRVESCGSSANSLAILEATEGKFESCVYAIGSYIAGDKGFMNSLSFMARQLKLNEDNAKDVKPCGFFLPMKIDSVKEVQRNSHVPLPYYIPHVTHKTDFFKKHHRPFTTETDVGCLHHYEDQCLSALHSQLIYRRIQGNPVKVLFFEPVLAGCGAVLSRRCYKILAALAATHCFRFVVDEVLTFGRLGYKSGFYTIEHFPKEMLQYVAMITVGKWLGAGLVLGRVADARPELDDDRQPSTKINLNQMCKLLNDVSSQFSTMDNTRVMIMQHLGITSPADTWGDGLLIYIPGYMSNNRKGPTNGLRCRLLPRVRTETLADRKEMMTVANKIYPGGTKGSFTAVEHWSRRAVNKDLVSTIMEYVSAVLPLRSVGYQEYLGMFIIRGYQQMGVCDRDRGIGDKETRSKHYDVGFKELEKEVGYLLGKQVGDKKVRHHLMTFLNKAKNAELP